MGGSYSRKGNRLDIRDQRSSLFSYSDVTRAERAHCSHKIRLATRQSGHGQQLGDSQRPGREGGERRRSANHEYCLYIIEEGGREECGDGCRRHGLRGVAELLGDVDHRPPTAASGQEHHASERGRRRRGGGLLLIVCGGAHPAVDLDALTILSIIRQNALNGGLQLVRVTVAVDHYLSHTRSTAVQQEGDERRRLLRAQPAVRVQYADRAGHLAGVRYRLIAEVAIDLLAHAAGESRAEQRREQTILPRPSQQPGGAQHQHHYDVQHLSLTHSLTLYADDVCRINL
ncbi:hypothetical protein PFISCL1PPCAC_4354 [Pristionchus fissidentatus]|uniref:Uncharacterized protein n=1 Tax=Pristionchus fissidentatus TaxID=1538716 RepID=A0AAV5V0I9_9BILA|nr:hypothetical protein PFISCL1PPCAC_4354 [Pristionchus fissidentatus]